MFKNPDLEDRIREVQNLIKQDKAHGYYIMALYYRNGWSGVPFDYPRALTLFETAAKKGHAGACYWLARTYIQGDKQMGIEKNLIKAASYATINLDDTIGQIDFYSQDYYALQLRTTISNLIAESSHVVSNFKHHGK